MLYLVIALVAYLLGSIPFGFILVRWFRGEDVRQSGSGNIGATNVARFAPALGVLTLLLDAAKGYLAVVAAAWIIATPPHDDASLPSYTALAAVAAVVGHIFPVWLKFRGGKGVATGVGAFLAVAPAAVGIAVLVFLVVGGISRYVSLGSIVAAGALPLVAYLFNWRGAVLVAMLAAAGLIITKHRQNIRRLLAGTEPRFEFGR